LTSKILLELLTPTHLALEAVTSIRESNRASKLFNHLATVGEGIGALGWVTIEGAECPKYVGEMRDASLFYGNRVVREYKDRYPPSEKHPVLIGSGDTVHKEWQTSFTDLLNELQKFVRKHYSQGIKWNATGVPADQFIGSSAPSLVASPSSSLTANANNLPPTVRTPSPGTGGPHPPPPPPPPPPPTAESLLATTKRGSSGSRSTATSMAGVFSQINQGEGITGALKHVDKSEMTHKNPSLREKRTSPHLPPKPASLQRNPSGGNPGKANKPATGKKALEGNKWIIVPTIFCFD
jgi:adenylyl cyclase-associated protein